MTKSFAARFGNLRENLSSPFIFVFILLLVSATITLIAGLAVLVGLLGFVAYATLVTGLAFQFGCYPKYNMENHGEP
jgi:uncharacterized membrane-anchored protein